MKKQKIQMIILLIVCLICVGGYFLLQNVDLEKEEETVSETIKLEVFDSEIISELTVTGENELHFVKKEDVWYSAEDETLNLDQATVQSLVRNLNTIYVDTKIDAPEDLSKFGLDEPSLVITAALTDGTSAVIRAGLYNDMAYCYYIQIEGDSNVYLADNYVIGACRKSLDEFAAEEETETAAE